METEQGNANLDKKQGSNENSDKTMSLYQHLGELRQRILTSFICWALSSIGGWHLANPILDYTRSMDSLKEVQLILIRPPEAFFVRMKIAMVTGLIISLPIILYEILAFISPGLTKNEKKWALTLVPGSAILFYGGASFALFLLLPIALNFFLVDMTQGIANPQISLEEYVNFLTALALAGGLVFQTPIILFFLTMIGILSSEKLKKARPAAIVICFVVAAVVTPPDPFSQVITALPMVFLYEMTIWLTVILKK
ncbi:MAG: twin-arginine translocase subunit TatC [Vulcanimicrobiota bacterium]